MMSLRRLATSSLVFTANILNPAIAFANPGLPALPGRAAPAASAEVAAEESAEAPAAPAAAPQTDSQRFVATGAPLILEESGFGITPPAGWDVETNTGVLSVVMREPRDEKPDYEKAKYQRNITIATMHKASPIDEKRATELSAQLVKNFSADASVSDFQVLEHKFFNYRGTNDGMLVYSSLKIGEFPMMQMHILVSGAEKQFLLTYTDLAERFSSQSDKGFEQAWNTMVGIEVAGETPLRQNEYMRYGAFGAGVLLLGFVVLVFRRKAAKKDYAGEADELDQSSDGEGMSHSMFATLAHGWRLDRKDGDDAGLDFSEHGVALKNDTRETEYVSSY